MTKNRILTLLTCAIILFSSCKNEYGSMGLNLKDNEFLGNAFTDTVSIEAYSLPEEPIATNSLNNAIVGELKDPVFGQTISSLYTQFALPTFGHSFGSQSVLDSVILTLAISNYYGDTTSNLHFSVYELSEDLVEKTTYYSNQTTQIKDQNIVKNGMFYTKPCPFTNIVIDTTTYEPHLRIPLSDEFGYKFLHDSSYNTSNEIFKTFFKGLRVDAFTYSAEGCLLYINLNAAISTITFYYKENNESTTQRKFTINTAKQVNYSNFTHFLASSTDQTFIDQVINGKKELGKEVLYIKPMAGVKTFITFPNLINTFKNEDMIINKAELVISNVSPDEELYISPVALSLTTKFNGETSYIMDDPNYSSSNTSNYFGGIYDEEKQEYRFRITRHLQYVILHEESDLGLSMTTRGAGIRGNRLILKGTDPGFENEKRLRLDIYYTTY